MTRPLTGNLEIPAPRLQRLSYPWFGYIVAVLGTVLAATLRWWLGLAVGQTLPPYITFYPVVISAAMIGGVGPGLLATALSALAVDLLFLPPVGLGLERPADLVGSALFFAINLALTFVAGRLRHAHRATQSSETRYRRLFEAAHDGVLLIDPATHQITDANPFITQLLGYPREQLLGKELWQIGLLKDAPASRAAFDQLAKEGHIRYNDLPLQASTGETRQVEFVSNVYEEDGHSVIQCNIRDITERKQADSALQRQARLIDLSPTATIVRNLEGHITFWSAGAQALYGWTPHEAIGRTTNDLLATEFPKPLDQIVADLRASGTWTGELRHRAKDGRQVVVESHWRASFAPDGQVVELLESNMDITERKQAAAQLGTELSAMNRLHELATRFLRQEDLVALLGAILDAAIATVGASKGNIQLFQPASGELSIVVQRGFDRAFVDYFSRIRAGQVACGTALQTKQRVVLEDITLSPLFLAQPEALQLKTGAGVRALVCTPLRARANKLLGVLSVHFLEPHRPSDRDLRLLDLLARQAADFIERTQSDQALRTAREKLAQANAHLDRTVQERTAKLREAVAELEGFSYSLVHDMRAPLRAMLSYAGILELEAGPRLQPQESDLIRKLSIAAKRMDHLINDSLNYSRVLRQDLPLGPVHLGHLLRGLVETYPNLHPPHAEVSIELGNVVVHGNQAALTQIFSNLLGNAVKFVAHGVHPRVRLWAEPSGPSTTNHQLSARVFVQDNGIGIPQDQHEKIFGMFQRLHRPDEYPGTGIGLALVKKSLERTGGHITLESEPGKGSRFCVELPLAVQQSGEALAE
jgi:PAS domain S-box-containing protein